MTAAASVVGAGKNRRETEKKGKMVSDIRESYSYFSPRAVFFNSDTVRLTRIASIMQKHRLDSTELLFEALRSLLDVRAKLMLSALSWYNTGRRRLHQL